MFAKHLAQQRSDCITAVLIINIANNESRKKLLLGAAMRMAKLAIAVSKYMETGMRNSLCPQPWCSEKVVSDI